MLDALVIVVFLLGVFLVAERLVWLMIRLAPRLGLMDHPGERRIHASVVPRAGGVAIFIAFMLGVNVLLFSGMMDQRRSQLLEYGDLWWVLAGATLLVIVGVIDDRFSLSAWWKLGAQILAATVFFVGTQRDFDSFMGYQVPWFVNYAIFVAWVVGLVNAFNLIDGMDGLCGGLGFISTGILLLLALVGPAKGDALILAVLAVALLAFLRYNFHPARIFLGDAGSMLIGYLIATSGMLTVGRRAVVAGLLLPLLVAGVPLFDVLLAVWRRGMRKFIHSDGDGDAPRIFGADKDHLHHRLMMKGFSQRQVVVLIYGIALLLSLLALLPELAGANFVVFSVLGLIVTGLLGLRYLARIEIVASQEGFRASLRKPMHRSWVAAGLFVYDAAVLAVSITFVMLITSGLIEAGWPRREKIITISTFVTCCLLSLRMGGASQRYWARGGVGDTVAMLWWLGCGIGLSGALVTVFLQDVRYWVGLCHLAAAPLAVAGLMLPRVLAVVLRESAVVAHHRRGGRSRPEAKRTLLYGAGNLGELFVFWLGISRDSHWSELAVVGFIDDQEALKGRQIRGFPVLGGLMDLEKIVRAERIDCVVVTMSKPDAPCLARLAGVAVSLNIEIFEWRPEMGMVPRAEPKGMVQVFVEPAAEG